VYIVPPGGDVGYRDYHQFTALAFSWTTELFSPAEWDALRALPGFWPLMIPFEADDTVRNVRLHISPEAFRGVEANAREIADELDTGEAAAGFIARGMLFRMLVHLARWNQGAVQADAPRAGAPRFADVLRVIEERYAEPLTVPQLAARLFLSTGAFNVLFRRETGVSPAAYLRRLRLDRAQTLLRETDDSIAHVATQSGFGDAAHFSRAFRAAFKMSPRQYREQWK
jgi:AraC-like DNA-binding protein